MDIKTFILALIFGIMSWNSYRIGVHSKKEEEDSLYTYDTPSSSAFFCMVLAGLFAIGFFLYSVGLWDIIGDALYKWLAP